jgi:hypothetical protein
MKTLNSGSLSGLARLAITALIASYLIWMPISSPKAIAAGFTANDGDCELIPSASGDYEISTAAELWELADCSGSSRIFRLTQDINLAGVTDVPTTSPIGTSTSPIPFSGTLDGSHAGGQYGITGMSMSASTNGLGLFRKLSGATFSNLAIESQLVFTGLGADGKVGSLAAESVGPLDVSNLSLSVSIKSGANYVGGLVGFASGELSGVRNVRGLISASGQSLVGGLIGEALGEVVAESLSLDVSLASSQGYLGGLIGQANRDVRISQSSISGFIAGETQVGGLVGVVNGGPFFATNSTNSAEISGRASYVGGFVGELSGDAELRGLANTGGITGGDSVGGFVGYPANGAVLSILSSHNYGVVQGVNSYVGGFFGYSENEIGISDSSNVGSVSASDSVGGLVGYSEGRIAISNSSNVGQVTGDRTVGGLVGHADQRLIVTGAINSGYVYADFDNAGGFVGLATGAASEFFQVQNSGQVSGANSIGGFIGRSNSSLFIERSQNTATISATGGGVGGFIGYHYEPTFQILDSMNAGNISGDEMAGGFFGVEEGDAEALTGEVLIQNAYQIGTVESDAPSSSDSIGRTGNPYLITVSLQAVFTNQVNSSFLSASSDADMKTKSLYSGWNFADVWGFVCGSNNDFPVLRFTVTGSVPSSDDCGSTLGTGSSGGTSSGSNSVGDNSTPTSEPVRYKGPMLVSLLAPVNQGATVTFEGTKLDEVTEFLILGKRIPILRSSTGMLTLTIPVDLAPSTYDVELQSSFGRLIVISALTVKAIPGSTQPDNPSQPSASTSVLVSWRWIPAFIGNSRALSDRQLKTAKMAATEVARTLVCWGYTTASEPSEWALTHATKRAEAACAAIGALRPDLKMAIRVKTGSPKSHAMRASLQFWK